MFGAGAAAIRFCGRSGPPPFPAPAGIAWIVDPAHGVTLGTGQEIASINEVLHGWPLTPTTAGTALMQLYPAETGINNQPSLRSFAGGKGLLTLQTAVAANAGGQYELVVLYYGIEISNRVVAMGAPAGLVIDASTTYVRGVVGGQAAGSRPDPTNWAIAHFRVTDDALPNPIWVDGVKNDNNGEARNESTTVIDRIGIAYDSNVVVSTDAMRIAYAFAVNGHMSQGEINAIYAWFAARFSKSVTVPTV